MSAVSPTISPEKAYRLWRYNIDRERTLSVLARSMPLPKLLRFYAALVSLKAVSEHPLNAALFFDDLFIAYREVG